MNTYSFETHSPEETERLGYVLGSIVPNGTVLALRGDLASGKTCFVRGMAQRFAGNEVVSSPTFTIVNEYGDNPRLYHVDLYRLAGPEELADLGYEELFEPDGVCAIEWAERAEPLLPERRIEITFELAEDDPDGRLISIADPGILAPDWARGFTSGQ